MLPIETERLHIRELSILDAGFMLQLMNTPDWLKNIGDRKVNNKSAATNYISQRIISSYRQHGFGLYLLIITATKEPAGICGLVKRTGLDMPDLGFALMPRFMNKGYASEAAKAVVDFAGSSLSLREIGGITTANNPHSIKVLEKAGLLYEKMILLPGDPTSFMLFRRSLHMAAC